MRTRPENQDEASVAAVRSLLEARRGFTTTPAFHMVGDLGLDRAHAVSEAVFETLHGDRNASVAGYKVSLVTPRHQELLGATEPTFGRFASVDILPTATTVGLASMYCPLVEPELVFVLDEDLSLGASEDEVRQKARVAAGLEIPDSRFTGWRPVPGLTVSDFVADNSGTGRLIVSEESVEISRVDLSATTCALDVDGTLAGTGVGAAVMGDPIGSLIWLSQALARRGTRLRAGCRVSSGTFMDALVAHDGVYVARFSDIGEVSVRFV